MTAGVTSGFPLATVIHENMKFSDRRQKCSYNNLLKNVAAQHFLRPPHGALRWRPFYRFLRQYLLIKLMAADYHRRDARTESVFCPCSSIGCK
jgi:hypothetical protein